MMNTPSEIGESVRLLAMKFELEEQPIWIDVKTRSDAIALDCYKDVERQIEEFGGEMVYGWQIWEWPRIMIEGEFHAVWRSPDGDLLDVSTKPDSEERIVFIPDPSRRYEERQIDNIRYPLWDHHFVHSYIAVCAAIHKEFDDHRIGELESLVDADKMEELEYKKFMIQQKIASLPRGKKQA